jgi:hypothetical protein
MAANQDGHNAISSDEVRALIESNSRCWADAARDCEDFAQALNDKTRKRELELMAAVYKERADLNTKAISRMKSAARVEIDSSLLQLHSQKQP